MPMSFARRPEAWLRDHWRQTGHRDRTAAASAVVPSHPIWSATNGGGGVIVAEEIQPLANSGVHIFSPEDGQKLGLAGMINQLINGPDTKLAADTLLSGGRQADLGPRHHLPPGGPPSSTAFKN